jgi:gliding motility-associated-like protein
MRLRNGFIPLLLLLFTFSESITLHAQVCTAKILQNDTTICIGSSLQLTVSVNDSSDNCNTYSLSSSLQNGLLGWFPFCGNTNDIGPQHNNAAGFGPLSYGPDRYNKPNTAIYFTGNGESVHTNKIERTTTNSFTYVTWVNTSNSVVLPPETINPLSGFSVDLSSTCVIHATHGYNWVLDHNNTGAGLFVATNGVFVLEHSDVIVPTPLVWQGNLVGWHSVALVYDNHVPKLYIDGEFVKSGLVTPYIVHPSFGCDSFYTAGRYAYITSGFGKGFNPSGATVPSNNFKGAIDDIKIYNRALSASEIAELYSKDKSSILWSTGDTTKTITVYPSHDTSYSVTVTNSLGSCRDTVNISVKSCTTFTCDETGIINNDTTVCKDATIQLKAKPAFAYSWSPKTGLSDTTIQNPVATIDSTRTYYLTSMNLSDNLVQNGDFEQGNAGISSQYVYCNSGNCLYPEGYYAVGSNPTFFQPGFFGNDHTSGSGNFMIINGASIPNTSVWCQSITLKPNTDYVFSTWVSNMVVGVEAQLQFSINGKPLDSVFTAPANQYEWKEFYAVWNSGNNATATICIVNQNTTAAGNDFGLDDIFFGQVASCTDSIHIKTLPKSTANITVSICSGQSYILPSGRSVSAAGVYSDTLRYKAGCDSVVFTVSLTTLSPQFKNLTASICSGQSYILPSGRSVRAAGVYNDTLKYKAGCDSVIFTVSLSTLNPQFNNITASICSGQVYILPSGRSVNVAGVYSDTLKYSAGCDSVILNLNLVINLPTSSYITQTICNGQSYTLPSGKIVNAPGIYLDTIQNSNGCDSMVTTELKYYPPISVKLNGPSTVCEGSVATIIANASGGKGTSYNYLWLPAANNANQIQLLLNAGTKIYVSVTDGCTLIPAADSLIVEVLDKPSVHFSITPQSGCAPLAVSFANATSPPSGNLYTWNFGDNTSASQTSPSHTYNTAGSYNVSLLAINSNGCSDSFKIIEAVSVANKPVAAFSTSPSPNTMANSRIEFSDMSEGATTWQWNFGDGIGTSDERDPVYVYKGTGNYMPRLIISGSGDCADTAYTKILIEGGSDIYIPNAFTPNGDGINDNFKVLGIGIQSVEMTIYGRWGEKVFEQKGNPVWNGNDQRGVKCLQGTYVYLIRLIDVNGTAKNFKGIVSVIR